MAEGNKLPDILGRFRERGEEMGFAPYQKPTPPVKGGAKKPRQVTRTRDPYAGLRPREIAPALAERVGLPEEQVLSLLNAGWAPTAIEGRAKTMSRTNPLILYNWLSGLSSNYMRQLGLGARQDIP